MRKVWTIEEQDIIKANAQTMKDKDLANLLTLQTGRTVSLQALRKQRKRLGIFKESGRGKCGIKMMINIK